METEGDGSYLALIYAQYNGILYLIVNAKTEKCFPLHYINGIQFVKDLPELIDNRPIQKVVVNVFQYPAKEFNNDNLAFHYLIREILNKLKIEHCFISDEMCTFSTILTATNVIPAISDTYLCVLTFRDYNIAKLELTFTEAGYMISNRAVFAINPKDSNEANREKLLGTCTPKKILLASTIPGDPVIKLIRNNYLKSKKLICVEGNIQECFPKFVVETAKWMSDKTYVKFRVLPRNVKKCGIFSAISPDPLIFGDLHIALPFKKDIFVSSSYLSNLLFVIGPTESNQINKIITFGEYTERYRVSLEIDAENFPSFSVVPAKMPKVEELPKLFDKLESSKIPIITFFENLAVVCVNHRGRYKFLKSWNGVSGEEIVISFVNQIPIYGKKAAEAKLHKPDSSIYDLINIMSMENENMKIDKDWKFSVTKLDDDYPVLLQFENFDGCQKGMTPSFAMAMILKEIRKRIRKAMGEGKPAKFGFCFLQHFDPEERKRIETKLSESCKMLKMECEFPSVF